MNTLDRVGGLAIVLLLLAGCSSSAPKPTELSDAITTGAAMLRWEKKSAAVVPVGLRFPPPVAIIALPPGRHTADELTGLFISAAGKDHVARWTRRISTAPTEAELVVIGSRGFELALFNDERRISIPNAIGVWKEDDSPLQVSLERRGDEVRIIELR